MSLVQNAEGIVYNEVYLELKTVICYKCGVPFAMPSILQKHFADTGQSFHCPNGHSQAYVESTETRLRKQLEKANQEKEHLQRCRDRAEKMYRHSDIERKKVKTRLKNVKAKIVEGVCPCCDQSFPDLHSHMTSAHPEFKETD